MTFACLPSLLQHASLDPEMPILAPKLPWQGVLLPAFSKFLAVHQDVYGSCHFALSLVDMPVIFCFAGRPWYTNIRPLAVPVVTGYVITCILYIVIRAAKSIRNISAPGYGVLVLVMEALGMVSLLQAGINHLYKVWSCEHQTR